jgi:hypothetical protein
VNEYSTLTLGPDADRILTVGGLLGFILKACAVIFTLPAALFLHWLELAPWSKHVALAVIVADLVIIVAFVVWLRWGPADVDRANR